MLIEDTKGDVSLTQFDCMVVVVSVMDQAQAVVKSGGPNPLPTILI